MGTIQFMFANPIKKKGKTMRKKTVKRGSNPFKFVYQATNGKKVQGQRFLTNSEFKNIRSGAVNAEKAVKTLDGLMRKSGNQVSDVQFKSISTKLKAATTLHANQKKLLAKAIANKKKADIEAKKYLSKGYKVVDQKGKEIRTINSKKATEAKALLDKAIRTEKAVEKELKKLKAKEKTMAVKKKAKKRVVKKKVGKKVTKRKVAKKATKKKVTKKKVAKKKVAKKKVAKKKVTKRKVAKKPTRRKVAKKKVTKRKVAKKPRRKVAKKKTTKRKVAKETSNNRKTFAKKVKKLAKNKSVSRSYKSYGKKANKGKKYKTKVTTKRTNPIGGKMKNLSKKAQVLLKHDVGEMGGLVAGGFTYQMASTIARKGLAKIAPNMLDKVESSVVGSYLGSILPIALAVGAGAANKKFLKNNKTVDALVKGLVGAGLVGIGVSLHETVMPSTGVATPVAGYNDADLLNHDFSSNYEEDLGTLETQNFGNLELENFGALETSDFGALETSDFGAYDEFDTLNGEMEI
jgi:hypothetical protein